MRLSSTLMAVKISRPSGTWTMPRPTMSSTRRRPMSSPSNTMRPALAADQAGDAVERRGLAGAVGAEQAHDLPGLDLQRHVLQRRDLAVGGMQAVDAKHRPASRDRPRSRADRCGSRSGEPSAIFWPKFSTVIRSATDMTSCITCSTSTMVTLCGAHEIEQQRVDERDLAVAQAGRRLVEQQQARRAGERAREVEQLLAAEIELAGEACRARARGRSGRGCRRQSRSACASTRLRRGLGPNGT